MAIRMQQRRGTADQWLLSDPVLGVGEIGFETDTNSFKIGDGVNSWATLDYFTNESGLAASLEDYIIATEKAAPNGVATLDANGFVPAEQLDIDVTADINAAVAALVDTAPGTLDTLNELAAAIGDDANFATTVTTSIAAKADKLVSFIYKTGSATLSLTDADKIVEVSGAATITVPTDAAAAFPVGTTINITQTGTGTVTVVGDSGVTVNSTPSNTLRDQWSSAVLIKRAANTWLLSGDMLQYGLQGVIPKGTPIAHLIPIKRSAWKSIENDQSLKDVADTKVHIVRGETTPYKKIMWHRKKFD